MSSVYSSKATTVWQLPLHVDPFPVNPFLQEHMKEPSVLTQSAFSSHVFATRHSSTSNEEQKISFFLYRFLANFVYLSSQRKMLNQIGIFIKVL